MAFHKKGGLAIEDMVRSRWVYRKLRNFRAGIEADISCLKRAYGLARCSWRGLGRFHAYVWSSLAAYKPRPVRPRLIPGYQPPPSANGQTDRPACARRAFRRPHALLARRHAQNSPSPRQPNTLTDS
jgi:IS5 family transposase